MSEKELRISIAKWCRTHGCDARCISDFTKYYISKWPSGRQSIADAFDTWEG